jgi:ATP-dependent Clp protease adaptor protein ClpS
LALTGDCFADGKEMRGLTRSPTPSCPPSRAAQKDAMKRLYTRLKEQGSVVTFSMSRLLRKHDAKFAATLVIDLPHATLEAPTIEKQEVTKQEIEMPWNVIVHNDPVNLMSYVTMVFQRVFGYPRERAEKHMLEVHNNGRSILWSGVRERAELYVQQLHCYLLLATIEKTV